MLNLSAISYYVAHCVSGCRKTQLCSLRQATLNPAGETHITKIEWEFIRQVLIKC